MSTDNNITVLSSAAEPQIKKMKTDGDVVTQSEQQQMTTAAAATCQHFVTRKKRYCKMTVAKGRDFCGEHIPNAVDSAHEDSYISADKKTKRIPCPLDPKHTVYAWNVNKHLKICNAKPAPELPPYIVRGINSGRSEDAPSTVPGAALKLADVPRERLNALIAKVQRLYDEHVLASIHERILGHECLADELRRTDYGAETRKHLVQTASILGYLRTYGFLQNDTSFIEFGAGKGQVSYWLAQIITELSGANVILVDRASHRHKQDNKVTDRNVVHRIRADISDFVIDQLDECRQAKHVVGVSKHLCGAATDLAIRCMMGGGGSASSLTKGFVIALCCHHRCEWTPFVGKKFLLDNDIGPDEFAVLTKMVSWAICGTGMSRKTRQVIENKTGNFANN